MAEKTVEERVKELLEESFWLTTLETDNWYSRTHDDCDGDLSKALAVIVDRCGDVHLDASRTVCRFRQCFGGGGQSPRVRNALLILAEAIRLDNKERPQGN